MADITELDKRLAIAEMNIEMMRQMELRLTSTFNERFSTLEKKLNNGLSEDIKANTQFRRVTFKVLGWIGAPLFAGFGYLMWQLLINLEKILKLVEAAK